MVSLHVCGQFTMGLTHFATVTATKGLGSNVVVDLSAHRIQELFGTRPTTVTVFPVTAGVQEAIRLAVSLATLAAIGVALWLEPRAAVSTIPAIHRTYSRTIGLALTGVTRIPGDSNFQLAFWLS